MSFSSSLNCDIVAVFRIFRLLALKTFVKFQANHELSGYLLKGIYRLILCAHCKNKVFKNFATIRATL